MTIPVATAEMFVHPIDLVFKNQYVALFDIPTRAPHLSISMIEETLHSSQNRPGIELSTSEKKRVDPVLLNLGAELSRARMNNKQNVPLVNLSSGFVPRDYQDIMAFEFAVRTCGREFRVDLRHRETPPSFQQTASGVFVDTPASSTWVWMPGDDFDIPETIMRTTERHPNIYLLSGREQIERLTSGSVADRILSYDFTKEMLGAPHDQNGVRFVGSYSNNVDLVYRPGLSNLPALFGAF
jgi:hypothetical protein